MVAKTKPVLMTLTCLMCFGGDHDQCKGEERTTMIKNKREVTTIMRCVCVCRGKD